ncbi:MAG: hypothetical protein JWM80_6658 [Cyanobacteria bacterium RYN_339]|nr:hypothetical protein [Cyanobacteria bacterium RYN_339]
MPNRLAHETSPYLRQHAHNPVDWYPWGPEAFARARAEGKPILLSVGYAACHWCHVMERESFEDAAIAAQMNELFVNVKVDREERPDVDSLYMTAVQTLSGHGGWPMTVFLTPDGTPFYGGTYFPPQERHGMPAFPRVLEGVARAFHEQPEKVAETGRELVKRITEVQAMPADPDALDEATLQAALASMARQFDTEHGGFGDRPKFPAPMAIELWLRAWKRHDDEGALALAERSLEMMARGGLYDHLGGGFHRYSVDERWLVPHFEKMLYDNAQLARAYLLAYQATRKVLYEVVATETLDYVVREMTSPEGGFYATQDADSEGEEGKFFVWSHAEVLEALGPDDGRIFAAVFDVTPDGNFEGHNVLHLPRGMGEVAKAEGVHGDRLTDALSRGRQVLFDRRERRVKPGRDEKVIASWNGMMLKAFALAASVLGRADYLAVAERNAAFLLDTMRVDGRLRRTYKDGQARLDAYLEDHANVVDGLLALYEATLTPRWLEEAIALARVMTSAFWDPATEAFYDTGKGHEELITRPRDLFDNATPAGNSVAADVLLRLAALTGDATFAARARAALAGSGPVMRKYPLGAARALCALDFHLARVHEVVLVGPPADDGMQAFRSGLYFRYLPYVVLAGGGEREVVELSKRLPLLVGRGLREGRPTAYVCHGFTCQAPTTDPAELLKQLE